MKKKEEENGARSSGQGSILGYNHIFLDTEKTFLGESRAYSGLTDVDKGVYIRRHHSPVWTLSCSHVSTVHMILLLVIIHVAQDA